MTPAEILLHLKRWKHEMDHAAKICDTYLDPQLSCLFNE